MKNSMVLILTVLMICFAAVCLAGEAHVLKVKITNVEPGGHRVLVTVQHDDEGREHYVDRWEMLDMEKI